MSKEKQIDDMAKAINGAVFSDFKKGHGACIETISTHLYNAGYRKASEVAREIFAEIEKSFIEYYDKTITYSSPTLPLHIREAAGFSLNEMFMKIAELKKKYESEKENGI